MEFEKLFAELGRDVRSVEYVARAAQATTSKKHEQAQTHEQEGISYVLSMVNASIWMPNDVNL